MPTKKKTISVTCPREIASPRATRSSKKLNEVVKIAEKKVADLITSSTRKHKVGNLSKKGVHPVAGPELNTRHALGKDKASNNGAALDKECNGVTGQQVSETIFSPSFHLSKNVEGETDNGVNFAKFFSNGDQNLHQDINIVYSIAEKDSIVTSNAMDSCCSSDIEEANLSTEVSAIYLAMKNSKLECVDEHGQDSLSMDVCNEDDDFEDFEEFDPFLFIKSLPSLSSVVPTFRPVLLPKQTRSCPPTSLVLDLDETLVHSTLEPCNDADFTFPVNFNSMDHTIYVRCRPHLKEFMEKVASLFEIIIFTASQSIYAQQLLNILDPKRKYFRHRVYRDSCVFVEGNYLKDLSVLGRDLSRVIIIDNSPQVFGFQVDNGIPIESWFDDRSDKELLSLLPFLESLVGVEDVRPLIAKKFNLQEKVAAAVYPPSLLHFK